MQRQICKWYNKELSDPLRDFLLRSVELTNMAASVGHSVVFSVAFPFQTFVFATKAKGKVGLMRTECQNGGCITL